MTTRTQRSEQRVPQRPTIRLRTSRNRYDVDPAWVPDGMTWEFKRKTILGQEDVDHQIQCEWNHWTPVSADRVPELMGPRAKAGQEVVIGGMVLMERPVEITEQARSMERNEADQAYEQQMRKVNAQAKSVSPKLVGVRRDAPEPIPEDVD